MKHCSFSPDEIHRKLIEVLENPSLSEEQRQALSVAACICLVSFRNHSILSYLLEIEGAPLLVLMQANPSKRRTDFEGK